MKFPLYIAKRYLFAKKSRNVINIISGISIAGLAVGTMALIIVLSVFNGLEVMVTSLFSTFDPQLKITILKGKTFDEESAPLLELEKIEDVESFALTLEENVLLRYEEQQYVATIKGVDSNYSKVTGIEETIRDGDYILQSEDGANSYCIVGLGVAQTLGIGTKFDKPIYIYVPDKRGGGSLSIENSFHRDRIYPSAIFELEQSFDSRYLFLPISYVRNFVGNKGGVSSIELQLKAGSDEKRVKEEISALFGDDFQVSSRFEQQEIYYKVMRAERLVIFCILTLIIIIASFNIIGSLTMLIIEKEHDIKILRSMGADNNLVRKIFTLEGWMISIMGTIIGVVLGFIVCWIQYKFGIVKLNSDTLILDSYPIALKAIDFIIVPITVLTIGYVAAIYPAKVKIKDI